MAATDEVDLGSLLRPGARGAGAPTCALCESTRVTKIALELEDGSQVDFTNCMDCDHRVWQQGDDVLSVERVLSKARRSTVAS
jgi:hypothetical protein